MCCLSVYFANRFFKIGCKGKYSSTMNNVIQSPSVSPKDFKELTLVGDLLRCGICYEYFNIAMMTTCSHNYCSLCIRKYMSYKSECPLCFTTTSEPELRNNRILDQLVQNFLSLRNKLFDLLQSDESDNKIHKKRKSDLSIEFVCKKIKSSESVVNKSEIKDDKNGKRPNLKKLGFNKDDEIKLSSKVPCPVCSVEISTQHINRHVESCLESSEKKFTEIKEKRPTLPKLVYHLMSDRDLKMKLKAHGLNTIGDRQTLIKRHHLFTMIYNAECDSLNPRPVSEILQQVVKQEKDEKWNGKSNFAKVKLNCLSRKTDPQTIEMEQKQYLSKHKNQFDDLIKNIKQREKQKNSPRKSKSVQHKVQPITIPDVTAPPEKRDSSLNTSGTASFLTAAENDSETSDDDVSLLNSISVDNIDDFDAIVAIPGTSGVQFRTSSPIITSQNKKLEKFDSDDDTVEIEDTGGLNQERDLFENKCDSTDSDASVSLLQ